MPPKKAKAAGTAGITDEIAEMKAKLLNKLSDKGADLDEYKKKLADGDGDAKKDAAPPPAKKPKKSAQPDPAPTPASASPACPPDGLGSAQARWQVLLGGNWSDFPADHAKQIEDAYMAKNPSVTLPPQRGQVYIITFSDNKQTNKDTKKQRDVRRLEPAGKLRIQTASPPPPAPNNDDEPKSPTNSPKIGEHQGGNLVANADDEAPDLATATFTLVPVPKDSEEFWDLEEKFGSGLQGRNEDYVAKRLEKKQKPISFVLRAAEKIVNPVLEKRFAIRKALLAQVTQDKTHLRERASFHGTHPRNIANMCKFSLLRFKHPLNPCKSQVDDGYFGSNKKGVYVSRYADYTFKYANRQIPLEPGEQCKIIQFRTLPGRSKHIPKMCGPIDPTEGYDSHSSPSFLEWFLFNEDQLLPEYVLTVEAREDTRTAADDM
eukprot:EG_transcript_8250